MTTPTTATIKSNTYIFYELGAMCYFMPTMTTNHTRNCIHGLSLYEDLKDKLSGSGFCENLCGDPLVYVFACV
jgi:hypothetical protein